MRLDADITELEVFNRLLQKGRDKDRLGGAGGDQLFYICPFCGQNSFDYNTEKHAWFCHHCSKGGGFANFLAEYFEVEQKNVGKMKEIPFLEEVQKFHEDLQDNREFSRSMLEGWGCNWETVSDLLIGWNTRLGRYSFPIFNDEGKLVNIRYYRAAKHRTQAEDATKVIHLTGYGTNWTFPSKQVVLNTSGPIYIVEGEKDCLVARSYGLNAITSIAGIGSITNVVSPGYEGREVVIMVDDDKAGNEKIPVLVRALRQVGCVAMKRATFSASMTGGRAELKDFTEFIESLPAAKRNTKDVLQLMMFQEVQDIPDAGQLQKLAPHWIPDVIPQEMALSETTKAENLQRYVKINGIQITGSDAKTYVAPEAVLCHCDYTTCKKMCPRILLGNGVYKLKPIDLINIVESPDTHKDRVILEAIQARCKECSIEYVGSHNLQKVFFQGELKKGSISKIDIGEVQSQTGYYMYQDGTPLTPTKKYNLIGSREIHGDDQLSIYAITKVEECTMMPERSELEDAFQYFKDTWEKAGSSFSGLSEFHHDKWSLISGIEKRWDIFIAIALTYLSVTWYKVDGHEYKGWMDVMLMGDTKTGKTQFCKSFSSETELGEFLVGESASRTGLLYSIREIGNGSNWTITWGAIPLNNRGLVIIDEASGLSDETISLMSNARSEGDIVVARAVTSRALAQTRLLWICNPRTTTKIASGSNGGIKAFEDFIRHPEDRSRFDMVVCVTTEEVEKLERPEYSVEEGYIEKWRALIQIAWNLDTDQITVPSGVLHKEAEDLERILAGCAIMPEKSSFTKLGRIAIAIAVFRGAFTYRDDFEGRFPHFPYILEVLDQDIVDAKNLIVQIFSKESFSYVNQTIHKEKAIAKKESNRALDNSLMGTMLQREGQISYQAISTILGVDSMSKEVLAEGLKTGYIEMDEKGIRYIT